MKSPEEAAEKTPQALREEAVLRFWDENDIFEKTLKKEAHRGEFVFYDGPPYATGLPHYGNLLPSTIKDLIPRFKTMQGFRVLRKWGWDCHGLPIETLIEKRLGLTDKKSIIDYGIEKFNKAARESVLEYDREWQKIIQRLGRWVDMENAYYTMDPSYTESVWWSFKELHKKGLVYQGFRSMLICPRCETTLSNFEVGQGYKDVQDISVYPLFELVNEKKTYFLSWTTTPWTLHGNAALAVNPAFTYVKVKTKREGVQAETSEDIFIILAEARLSVLKAEYEIIEKMQGADLVGLAYIPPFDTYFKNDAEFPIKDHADRRANAWKVYAGEFVTDDAGTGIVHIAPAFGEDDYKLGVANNLPLLQHVTFQGLARAELGAPFANMPVKSKEDPQSYDIEIIKALAHAGLLFAKEKITHSYPHCWRCGTPLLNYATSAWFIEVTKVQNRFIEENNKVKWIPESVGSGRFGEWLENLRDWNVSRSRFWGSPLPVWKGVESGKIEVLGSVAELKDHIEKRNSFRVMRHGESESNVLGIISSTDLEAHALTEKGRGEVHHSIEELKKSGQKITKIYASDFRRTRESAELAADLLDFPKEEIVFDKRLRECLAGGFDGQTWAEHWAFFKNRNEKMFKRAPDGGESIFDVKTRAAEFMYEIDAANKDENILIITHGQLLRMISTTSAGKTGRDLIRIGWSDEPDPTASIHPVDWRNLPHNESFELDVHRPYIDEIKWQDPETKEEMIRIPEVFDVWYDAGSMPFAQNHYPFENTEEFEKWKTGNSSLFPADFIAEGLDQTRGWFYALMALGVGLFDRSPYEHVVVNGLILAEDGRKMSKSLNNYPPLMPTVEKYGADAFRFFLASSPATHGEEVAFSEKALDEINKKVFNRLENMYAFLEMYKSGDLAIRPNHVVSDGVRVDQDPPKGMTAEMTADEIEIKLASISNPLDFWVLSRLNQLIDIVTKNLEGYVIDKAIRPIAEFIDDVSTWYVRRSRDRFKTEGEDKETAIFVTRFVLEKTALIMAPVTPFIAEDLYQKVKFTKSHRPVKGEVDSVHLRGWPLVFPLVPQAISGEVRTAESKKGFEAKIISEMKIVQTLVEQGLALRAGAKIKVRQPLSLFTYPIVDNVDTEENVKIDTVVLSQEMEDIIKDELNVKEVRKGDALFLDTEITEELREEGAVRDVIRAIQEERKNQNLNPKDIVKLTFGMGAKEEKESEKILRKYEEMIKNVVNAGEITYGTDISAESGSAYITLPFLEDSISFHVIHNINDR